MNIEATENTPAIIFEDNTLTIRGEIRPENPRSFFDPILVKLSTISSDRFTINCEIPFMSSSSILQLKRLFLTLMKQQIENLEVFWNYEEDDLESKEIGGYLREITDIPMKFVSQKSMHNF